MGFSIQQSIYRDLNYCSMFRLFLPSSFRDPGLKNQISLLPSATLLHKLCMRRAIANSKATRSSIFYLNVGSSWDSHSAGRFILQTQHSLTDDYSHDVSVHKESDSLQITKV